MTNPEQLKQLQEEEELLYDKMAKIIRALPKPKRNKLTMLMNNYIENQLEQEELCNK